MTVYMGRPTSLDVFDIATTKELRRQVLRLPDVHGRPDIIEFLCKDVVSGNGFEFAADRIRAVDISITRFSRPPDLRDWHGSPLKCQRSPEDRDCAPYAYPEVRIPKQSRAHPEWFSLK